MSHGLTPQILSRQLCRLPDVLHQPADHDGILNGVVVSTPPRSQPKHTGQVVQIVLADVAEGGAGQHHAVSEPADHRLVIQAEPATTIRRLLLSGYCDQYSIAMLLTCQSGFWVRACPVCLRCVLPKSPSSLFVAPPVAASNSPRTSAGPPPVSSQAPFARAWSTGGRNGQA